MPPRLPLEVVERILAFGVYQDPTCSARVLVLSTDLRVRLHQAVYGCVELHTSLGLERFAELVQTVPAVARSVRSLWIGPGTTRSDLVSILSAPMPGDSSYIERLRETVYAQTRTVLRKCRRLIDVALSGSLVSTVVVHSYGTACQPLHVTSINPHSFVGGYDAPIFRKVQTLAVIDINLSDTEAEAIQRMPSLRTLTYTAPKDYGDTARDARILSTLLGLRKDTLAGAMERLALSASLSYVCYRTLPQRLEPTLRKLYDTMEHEGVRLVHEPIPFAFVEEWDALRDLVFSAQGDYSRAALEDTGAWADPGHALAQVRREWRQRIGQAPGSEWGVCTNAAT